MVGDNYQQPAIGDLMRAFEHQSFFRFFKCRSGAIAPLFGLTVVVMMGGLGLAIDSARVYGQKSKLQNSVDAAVLATARRVALDPTANITSVFTSFLNASNPVAHDAVIASISVSKSGNAIDATVKSSMPSTFMQLFGTKTVRVDANSQAEFGIGDIELVLALDNTASMAGGKIATLKDASQRLVDSLSRNAPSPDKLRVGVVPFAKYVNVGMGNRNASWITVPTDWNETVNWCGNTYPNATYTNCRTVYGTCTNDGIQGPCNWQECDTNYGPPVYQCTSNVVQHRWNGCVSSRAAPLNVTDGGYGTRIPGKMDESCAQPLTPLTTDRETIRDAIDAMTPAGDTYIPEGVMWGWRLLSPQAPFDESQSGGSRNVSRYLVLMTDGVNSVSATPTGHDGSDTAGANATTLQACANAKADGITIFTVAFQVTDTTVKDVLTACATNGGYFYDAADSAQLLASFDAIGQQLVSLRLKK